jgi:hypothetical protein
MADQAKGDLVAQYREYLERFAAELGEGNFGDFVKHKGKLIKKLAYDDFEPIYNEYHEVATAYFESVDRGDTINDIVVKLIRERAAQLILASPV